MVAMSYNAEVELEADSDGDAPEQVTLSSGREEAQKIRKDERENQRRVQVEAKQRRQRTTAPKAKEDVAVDKQKADFGQGPSDADGDGAQDDKKGLDFSKSARTSGLLDASIVDFLATREKNLVEVSRDVPGEADEPSLKKKHKRAGKRRKTDAMNSSDRGKTVILAGERPPSANFRSAVDFKRERLYGDRLERSPDMLPKPRRV